MQRISLLLLFLFFISCNQDQFYFQETYKTNGLWAISDSALFSFPVKKSDSNYDLHLVLRNNNEYPYSNIYFFTTLLSPNGKKITDTLEYQLAKPNGEWIGYGMGSIKQNTLVLKENIALKDTGLYYVNVVHAMRKDTLLGIEDISLTVKK